MKARDLMTAHNLWACSETSNATQVAEMMANHNVGAIPVLDAEGRLEGIVTDRDICCRIVAARRSLETPIRSIMTTDVHTVGPEADMAEIESILCRYAIRRLPVVGPAGKLLGFISLADLASHCHGTEQEHELAEVLESVSAPM